MNCKTQLVLATGIGYLLGRQHKLRWGLLLAAAAAGGRLSRPGGVLHHGVRALGSSPEIGKLGELGAPLVEATKDAARAAVTGRIDSMSGRLRERADVLREPGKARKRQERPEDREPEEQPEDRGPEEPPEDREPEQPARDRRARPARAAAPEPEPEWEDEDEDASAEAEDEEPVRPRARTGGRPPVRRREG